MPLGEPKSLGKQESKFTNVGQLLGKAWKTVGFHFLTLPTPGERKERSLGPGVFCHPPHPLKHSEFVAKTSN